MEGPIGNDMDLMFSNNNGQSKYKHFIYSAYGFSDPVRRIHWYTINLRATRVWDRFISSLNTSRSATYRSMWAMTDLYGEIWDTKCQETSHPVYKNNRDEFEKADGVVIRACSQLHWQRSIVQRHSTVVSRSIGH
jgi:hypothetical protein